VFSCWACLDFIAVKDLSPSHDLFGCELNDFLHRLGRNGLTLGEGADVCVDDRKERTHSLQASIDECAFFRLST
jgi:hypothetical protein